MFLFSQYVRSHTLIKVYSYQHYGLASIPVGNTSTVQDPVDPSMWKDRSMTSSKHELYPPTQPLFIPVTLAIEDLLVTIWPARGDAATMSSENQRTLDALRLSLASFQCTYGQFEDELAFLDRLGDRSPSLDFRVDFVLDVRRNTGSRSSESATPADIHALRQLLMGDTPLFVHFLEARRNFRAC
jgi:hypothetical protein